MKKKGIIIAIIILAIGFATVSTTLLLSVTIGVGADTDEYDIIFTSAKIGTVDQTIKKTNKNADTIEFDVLLNKVGEEKVLNYIVKNNSTQYEANANMKCYALNDTDEFMTKHITISGELAGKTITFAQVVGDAVLSDEINFKAQESKNGTITMSLKKSYAGDEEISVTLKCEIITNASSSDEITDRVDGTQEVPSAWTSPLYFAYGNPTTYSTTDWTTLGKDVFVAIDDAGNKGVCITPTINGSKQLECFKNNNASTEITHLSQLATQVNGTSTTCSYDTWCNFGSFACHVSLYGYEGCRVGSFDCFVYSNGYVYCSKV